MKKNSVKKNYLFNLSYQILAIIAPLITTPYVSRVLGADGVGIYNYTYAITYVFTLVCALGTRSYAQREIAYRQDSSEEYSKVFFEIMFIKAVSFLAVSIVYIITSMVYKKYTIFLLTLYLYILADFFDISWFFQGIEDFKKTVIRNSIVKIVSIILIFLLVKTEDDLLLYILILGGSTLFGQLSMWLYMPRLLKKCPRKSLEIKRHLKPTIILFLPSIAIYVYTFLDKIMLGAMQDTSEVGYYSQSEKIVKIAMTVITSLGTVLVPRLSNLIKKGEWNPVRKYFSKSVHFVFILGVPMMLGMIMVANDLVPWFLGDGFEKSILLMQLLSPLVLIIGIASVTGQAVLVSMERQSYYTVSVICGSVTNMLLNALLIPFMKSAGAVIATLMAELIVTSMQVIGVRKIVDLKKIVFQNIKCIISGGVMLVVLILSELFFIRNIDGFVIPIVLKVGIGVCSYSIMLLILREQIVLDVLDIIHKKPHSKRG